MISSNYSFTNLHQIPLAYASLGAWARLFLQYCDFRHPPWTFLNSYEEILISSETTWIESRSGQAHCHTGAVPCPFCVCWLDVWWYRHRQRNGLARWGRTQQTASISTPLYFIPTTSAGQIMLCLWWSWVTGSGRSLWNLSRLASSILCSQASSPIAAFFP